MIKDSICHDYEQKYSLLFYPIRLEAVRSVDGRIQNVHGKHLAKPRMKLDRTK